MPSPDLRPYVELDLVDASVSSIFAAALAQASAVLPGWVPREANIEVVLMEALALEVAEAAFALNRLPGAIMEVLLQLYGITLDLGAAPEGSVRFTLSDVAGHEVPAGTRLRLSLGADVAPLELVTTEGAVAAVGIAVADAHLVGVRSTAAANGTPPGVALELVSAVPYVESAQVQVMLAAGRDPETTAAWLDRGTQALRRLVTTLVTPANFEAAALTDPTIYRARAIDNWDSTLAAGAGGAANGHVTVAVLGPGGIALSAPAKAAKAAELDAQAQANLAVHVIDPTITAVAVTATVQRLAGYTNVQVQASVIAALDAFLSPLSWSWSPTVRRNELIARLDAATGVDYVTSLTVPAADVALPGAAPLPTRGATAITTTP